MRKRIRTRAITTPPDPLLRLWLLRLLVPLGGHRALIAMDGFTNDSLAEAVGLGHWIEPVEDTFDPKTVRAELRQLHRDAEARDKKAAPASCLRANVERLAALLGLGATDCRVLEFAVSIHNERLLDDTADWLGPVSSAKLFSVLATTLDLPEADIRSSLSAHGTLTISGLITVDRSGAAVLRGKLDLLAEDFADLMTSTDADPISLLRGTVSAAGPAHLGLDDFDHVRPTLDIVRPYLRGALAQQRRGVNIFLHGAPGTGKSQLARVLAQDLDMDLLEVASEDPSGDPINGERRLRAYRAAQSFFAKRSALLVFDEAEDVFNDGDVLFGRRSTAQLRKAWVNRMLESNPMPTVWLANSVRGLDPAFVRRFDVVIELPVPPKKQRERILRQACGDVLDDRGVAHIAQAESLTPAVVARASSVVQAIKSSLGAQNPADALEHLISNTLEAQGHRRLKRHDPNHLPDVYDPSFINADADLAALATNVAATRAARLCLYGPPGTGKTAYARWLAQQLGAPLLTRRASDLMSPWVGENEHNIAAAFHAADVGGSILLIDEVDTFLRDRRDAQRAWEASLVNEMLVQMESFAGVFIASTNLMDGLDQAALRRFDLKVKLDYLRFEQAWDLLTRHCTQLGVGAPPKHMQPRVRRLTMLTPGDFATVVRQHRLRPITSPADLIAAIEFECALKGARPTSIGFV